jgi:ankyrin repeat protein
VSAGADVDAKDFDDYTPFHLASLHRRAEIADLLNPAPTEVVVRDALSRRRAREDTTTLY